MKKKIFIFFIFTSFFFFKNSLIFSKENIGPKYIIEKPYKIGNTWYYPKENYSYNETGIATIYLSKIDSTYTKNGEKYYKNKVSAAHKTLPLPSIVRVINLQNGFAINVRINDRGPKNNLKIIQLSKKAGEILQIKKNGLVQIKLLPILSKEEYKKINKNTTNITNENLEKIDDLKKPLVKSEKLLKERKSENEKKIEKKEETLQSKETTDKLNFKRIEIPPVYLRIQIATFNSFGNASHFKNKFKKVYNKIFISLDIDNNQKFFNLKTVPLTNVEEAERILSIIHKKGYKNAKIIIERKK